VISGKPTKTSIFAVQCRQQIKQSFRFRENNLEFQYFGHSRVLPPPLFFNEHHKSHAASAFYASPFENIAFAGRFNYVIAGFGG